MATNCTLPKTKSIVLLFLAVPLVCLQFVIPDHTHLLLQTKGQTTWLDGDAKTIFRLSRDIKMKKCFLNY